MLKFFELKKHPQMCSYAAILERDANKHTLAALADAIWKFINN
jgi:hypothetical protein